MIQPQQGKKNGVQIVHVRRITTARNPQSTVVLQLIPLPARHIALHLANSGECGCTLG